MRTGEVASSRWLHRLLFLAAVFVLLAIVIGLTGGFVLSLGGLRVSVRNLRNPLLLTALCVAAAWAIAPRGQRWHALGVAWSRVATPVETAFASLSPATWRRVADLSAVAMAIAMIVVGVTKGSMVAGGSDSYGYVSQAHLWASGTLRIEPPLQGELPDGVSYSAFVPLGYRLAPDGRSIVPGYAPGFPMLMALFEIAGGPDAVFYAMPLLAAVTVLATYGLGVMLGGRAAGVLAALLLATSPTFLFQLTHAPMSDIAAAAWWTLALLLFPRRSRMSVVLAGLAVGMAVLTRPNLVPLVIVPGGWLALKALGSDLDFCAQPGTRKNQDLTPRAFFAVGPVVSALTVAALNNYWYGTPTASGYGALGGELFRWSYLWPNLTNYSRSLMETQSLGIVLAAVGPFMVGRVGEGAEAPAPLRSIAVTCIAFIAATYLCYAFYLPLEAWWSLRFFLPAAPALFVFMSIAVLRLPALLPLRPRAMAPLMLAVLVVLHPLAFTRRANALDSVGEKRFAEIGRYIAGALPPRAAVISVLHSGSVGYYSGRMTVRFDMLDTDQLETVASGFRQRGYAPFILIDVTEREDFAARFGDAARFGSRDDRAAALVPTVDLYEVH
jgi:hypothetical protein